MTFHIFFDIYCTLLVHIWTQIFKLSVSSLEPFSFRFWTSLNYFELGSKWFEVVQHADSESRFRLKFSSLMIQCGGIEIIEFGFRLYRKFHQIYQVLFGYINSICSVQRCSHMAQDLSHRWFKMVQFALIDTWVPYQ